MKNEAGKTIVAASVIKEEVTDVSFYGDYSGYYSANPYENHIEK